VARLFLFPSFASGTFLVFVSVPVADPPQCCLFNLRGRPSPHRDRRLVTKRGCQGDGGDVIALIPVRKDARASSTLFMWLARLAIHFHIRFCYCTHPTTVRMNPQDQSSITSYVLREITESNILLESPNSHYLGTSVLISPSGPCSPYPVAFLAPRLHRRVDHNPSGLGLNKPGAREMNIGGVTDTKVSCSYVNFRQLLTDGKRSNQYDCPPALVMLSGPCATPGNAAVAH
jgi:hypothetical protein